MSPPLSISSKSIIITFSLGPIFSLPIDRVKDGGWMDAIHLTAVTNFMDSRFLHTLVPAPQSFTFTVQLLTLNLKLFTFMDFLQVLDNYPFDICCVVLCTGEIRGKELTF